MASYVSFMAGKLTTKIGKDHRKNSHSDYANDDDNNHILPSNLI